LSRVLDWLVRHREALSTDVRRQIAEEARGWIERHGPWTCEAIRATALDLFGGGGRNLQVVLASVRREDPMACRVAIDVLAENSADLSEEDIRHIIDSTSSRAYAIDALGATTPVPPGLLSIVRPYVTSGSIQTQLAALLVLARSGEDIGDHVRIIESACSSGGGEQYRALEILSAWNGRSPALEACVEEAASTDSSLVGCLAFFVACKQDIPIALELLPLVEHWAKVGVTTSSREAVRQGVALLLKHGRLASEAAVPEAVRNLISER
jgi:hypothetical protein